MLIIAENNVYLLSKIAIFAELFSQICFINTPDDVVTTPIDLFLAYRDEKSRMIKKIKIVFFC